MTATSVIEPPSGSLSLASTSIGYGTCMVLPVSFSAIGGLFGTGCTATLIVPVAVTPSGSVIVYRIVYEPTDTPASRTWLPDKVAVTPPPDGALRPVIVSPPPVPSGSTSLASGLMVAVVPTMSDEKSSFAIGATVGRSATSTVTLPVALRPPSSAAT